MNWLLVPLIFLIPFFSWAEDHHSTFKESPSQFSISKDLLNEIYSAEVTEVSVETRYRTGALEVIPQFSLNTAQDFTLSNNYFSTQYNDSAFPLFHVTLATPLLTTRFLESYLQARVGYSYRESNRQVVSSTGLILTDGIKLHWLPLLASTRFALRVPGFSYVKPYFTLGAGAQWLNQDGQLDGIDQSFWIPFWSYGAGLTFFDESAQSGSWFGGAFVGLSESRDLGAQALRYRSWDLAISFVL